MNRLNVFLGLISVNGRPVKVPMTVATVNDGIEVDSMKYVKQSPVFNDKQLVVGNPYHITLNDGDRHNFDCACILAEIRPQALLFVKASGRDNFPYEEIKLLINDVVYGGATIREYVLVEVQDGE